ncbi:MAG: acyl carrier protein [Actinomycetota bacterium]|nr:acyl carrier protein [Actinomycetota bacterium]
MQVTREQLLKETREHLQQQRSIEPERVREDALLRDDLGLDSLDVAELGMRWAADYGVLLEEEQILNIETVGEALDFVMSHAVATPEG